MQVLTQNFETWTKSLRRLMPGRDLLRGIRSALEFILLSLGVRRGVCKGVEDGRRPSALQAGHPGNGRNTVSGVVRLQGVVG
jgi:hypothetical protein